MHILRNTSTTFSQYHVKLMTIIALNMKYLAST